MLTKQYNCILNKYVGLIGFLNFCFLCIFLVRKTKFFYARRNDGRIHHRPKLRAGTAIVPEQK